MGREATGIFYGVRAGEGTDDLLNKWHAKRRGGSPIVQTYSAAPLLGCWVAVPCGDSEEPGAADIDGMTISFKAILELPEAAAAHEAWERFRKWALEQGADFFAPEMWIASLEVG